MTTRYSLAVLLGVTLLASCDLYEKTGIPDLNAPLPSARIKFHNFSSGSVGVNFFANDVKMTAVTNAVCTSPTAGTATDTLCRTTGIEATAGTTYGNVASGGLYLAVDPAQYTLTSKIAAQSAVVSSVNQTIESGKYYSFFMSGVYNTTTKTAEAFVVEDPVPKASIDFSVAMVRFVNAVPNASASLVLYLRNSATGVEAPVGPAVAYKSAGAFVAFPTGVYDAAARLSGQTSDVTGLTKGTLSLVGGRVYTITARGSTATSSTLALDFTSNQQ